MTILANDGITLKGIEALEKAGFEVNITKVAQNQLENFINDNNIDGVLVNSNTQIRQELIEACPSLKLIGNSSVNMDNIDVDFAIDNGLHVINPKNASASSVAELVFAHLFGMARFLHSSNREMPLEGDMRFKELNKAYALGTELRGKTIGILGFDKVGQEVAKIAIGLGMHVMAYDDFVEEATITLDFYNQQKIDFTIHTDAIDDVFKESDFISLHLTNHEDYIITATEFDKMKEGVGFINTAKGGILNEVDLVSAIESGKVQYAGLDVFETEPTPAVQLLMNSEISLSPNIGSSTKEAQERAGLELANQIIKLLN
ncbi:D-2-hydroxyacid dehydrogenase [Polaribacter dokdonensis]|uniref:D-3-phosphoglycerate dehydrogenase n=1 Tax=Polaribacter dokdonensis DSW-5 TaxID=1300348 RepID=A0A0M9CHG1_9FLAO|nr:D-2-hydroxyacid dehydrogenase [Polaribacter dokdonensis]KOY52516.1 D-3-phosphoglycerate dehydrogenase [Polaribacter dokdonensis DSW-5]SEE47045.1 D-3-phosphoglycerate dehydrogenase [Polaribacter dokdonensis DSW-5]